MIVKSVYILLKSTVGGSRFSFWSNEKQNKFNKTSVLISNLCWILYFSRYCLWYGKVGLNVNQCFRKEKNVYYWELFVITGTLLWIYTNRRGIGISNTYILNSQNRKIHINLGYSKCFWINESFFWNFPVFRVRKPNRDPPRLAPSERNFGCSFWKDSENILHGTGPLLQHATSVWGLKLLVYETLNYQCMRP